MPPSGLKLDRLTDAKLLKLRFDQLPIRIQDTWLDSALIKLQQELNAAGLDRFRPNAWLSSEWFSPDTVPGIAIPFYLAHKRLMTLEKRQMLGVEGGSITSCMKLLRHEAGHAIDAAYNLRRRKLYRTAFGRFGDPYPDFYRPKPASKNYVLHLDWWYAQAHPAEDFAETFALWLTPAPGKGHWREVYHGWPAMKKLLAIDEMMRSIQGKPPANRTRRRVEPLSDLKTTLADHYKEKRLRYMQDFPDMADADLLRLFTNAPDHRQNHSAAQFVRHVRAEVRERVAECTATHPYVIDQVLRDTIDRCKELRLRLRGDQDQEKTKTDLLMITTAQTMQYLYRGPHPLAV